MFFLPSWVIVPKLEKHGESPSRFDSTNRANARELFLNSVHHDNLGHPTCVVANLNQHPKFELAVLKLLSPGAQSIRTIVSYQQGMNAQTHRRLGSDRNIPFGSWYLPEAGRGRPKTDERLLRHVPDGSGGVAFGMTCGPVDLLEDLAVILKYHVGNMSPVEILQEVGKHGFLCAQLVLTSSHAKAAPSNMDGMREVERLSVPCKVKVKAPPRSIDRPV